MTMFKIDKQKILILIRSAHFIGISLPIPTPQKSVFQEIELYPSTKYEKMYLKFSKGPWLFTKLYGNRIECGQADLALIPFWLPTSPFPVLKP
jgi:hypothetical protein